MNDSENFLECCLFFNTNALSRYLLKIAELEFKYLKLSPAHASLLLLVYDRPGISPKELSADLHLTPSTITRFVDSLVKKKLLARKSKGKVSMISPTDRGWSLKADVAKAYKRLYDRYTKILGTDTAHALSFSILSANKALSGHLNGK